MVRDLFPASGFQGQQPCELLIGLGAAREIDVARIRWPSGRWETFPNLSANRSYRIKETNSE
ncbi:MAG: hypothetical protein HKN23_17125 [Verrucomicrobiales bacterium]|nr:hypothetical protein [Verrucomicrobiales bacterium]